MRKIGLATMSLLICLAFLAILAGCAPDAAFDAASDVERYEVGYDSLLADDYKDYATEITLNTQKYPELQRQGLRLVTGYGASYARANEAAPTVDVIRQSFDPNKGILIILNGLQLDSGRERNSNMQSENRLAELEQFGADGDIEYFKSDPAYVGSYDLGKYWADNGYNVFYFHWEMFADHTGAISAPAQVQERIWSLDNGVQAVYIRDGKAQLTEAGEALNGCLAEWFVSEYIKMANAVEQIYPSYIGASHDIRIAGHLMGGVLAVASAALTSLVAEDGQLNENMTPNRLALMDSYLGNSTKLDYKVAWTGKKYAAKEGSSTASNYLAALRMLVEKYGVAAEFYCNEGFVVPFLDIADNLEFNTKINAFEGAMAQYVNAVLKLCPIVLVRPYFASVAEPIKFFGHNAIREWYLSTILYDAPTAVNANVTVPTARMSDEAVRALKGNYFVMRNERESACETVRCDDDTFVLNQNA